MVRKDFITSIVLIAFSLSVIVFSYTMPRLERRGIDPFSAPGVVPGMIGIILLILALILFFRSVRHGGYLFLQPGGELFGVQLAFRLLAFFGGLRVEDVLELA